MLLCMYWEGNSLQEGWKIRPQDGGHNKNTETLANPTGDLNISPSSSTTAASDITESVTEWVTEPVDHVRSSYYFPEQLFMASDVYYVENFKTMNWDLPQWYAYKGLKQRHHNTYNLPLNRGRQISLYFSFTVSITIWPILFQEGETIKVIRELLRCWWYQKGNKIHKGSTLLQGKYHLSSLYIKSGLFHHHCYLLKKW